MHDAVLHRFCAGGELADGNVEVAVHRIFRRPLASTIRIVVKKDTHASRKPKHRQQSGIGESLAQRVLSEACVICDARNLVDEMLPNGVKHCMTFCLKLWRKDEQYVARSLNHRCVRRNPTSHQLLNGRRSRCVWRLIPVCRVTKFAMHVVAAIADKKPKINERSPQNFFV